MNQALPDTQEGWIALLDTVTLPIAQTDRQLIQDALEAPNASITSIAETLFTVPTMALALMREANAQQSRLREPAQDLVTAVERIGINRLQTLLDEQQVLPLSQFPEVLARAQLISLYAMEEADNLFGSQMARIRFDLRTSSLLLLVPLWSLAATFPAFWEQWKPWMTAGFASQDHIERKLLGTSLLQIGKALAQRWHLPDWIVHNYQILLDERRMIAKAQDIARYCSTLLERQRQLDDDPELQRWLTRPENTVFMANGIALSASQGWSHSQSVHRWHNLVSLYLGISLEELQQRISLQTAKSLEEHWQINIAHPAQPLSTPPPPPGPPAGHEAGHVWHHCMKLLQERACTLDNRDRIIDCLQTALHACGLTRILILCNPAGDANMVAHIASGFPGYASSLTVHADNPLRRLLATRKAVCLQLHTNMTPLLLPAEIRELFDSDCLLICSVVYGKKRMALTILADRRGFSINDLQRRTFSTTCRALKVALEKLDSEKASY